MSINKLSKVMKTPMPDPIAKFIMVVLADHYNDSTGTCWPSIDTITEITGCSRRTVIRKLKMLEEAGLIIRYKRYNKTDIYEIFIGDTLTRDTVTPLGVTGWHTNSYRTLNKKKGGKIKISEWQLDDECRQYAKGKGLSPDGIMDSIRLWDEQTAIKQLMHPHQHFSRIGASARQTSRSAVTASQQGITLAWRKRKYLTLMNGMR